MDYIPSILDADQNSYLTAIPTNDEILKAVNSFEGNKAPGPNGFPMFFFQMYWHIVGRDVSSVVKELFGARIILKELNGTFIALIPKKMGADSMDLFRPISLCNSLYKIISKVLTSRILTLLPSIISPQQSGFVPGRQILDSIIKVHENIHSLSRAKKEGFFLKIDLSKAYDRVVWGFM